MGNANSNLTMDTSHHTSHSSFEHHQKYAPVGYRRKRTWSISMTSQSSTASQFPLPQKLYEASPAEVVQGDLQAHGSFTTTIPAVFWLRSCFSIHSKPRGKRLDTGWENEHNFELPDLPRSRSRSPARPFISRTSSMNSTLGEHLIPTLSSHDSPPASPLGDNISTLCPILEAIENASKLSCRTVCVTCLKTGRDFPHCPRCGDTWCSRECRMQGGKRHVCRT
ncbi:uncharacterized protein HD556DRAFT_1043091 [Suillus plorans]|uniref:HIT-type domain-containing protein n=1 Tax=Suillus plorans TaxID=116603 RepID=A0A9P7ACQ5_9AGAM|nr:uncharacterized protein HD556DRAFT_1043091 [Suillus plorans]KAG1786601.1 hypothetical protein HD556DRAFT_1043091 [Suillus plorans]